MSNRHPRLGGNRYVKREQVWTFVRNIKGSRYRQYRFD